jgi:hypothetical protein
MDDPITDDELEQGRQQTYAGVDKDLYLDAGFFTTWFGMAELSVTALLAHFTGSQDLEAFDILCGSLGAGTKVDKLRKAIKRHGKMGPELNLRLAYFTDEIVSLRNKVMHSCFSNAEVEGPRSYFLSGLANLPWEKLKMGKPKTKLKPTVVNSLDLYAKGVWLNYLAHDLGHVVTAEDQAGEPIIEIIDAKSKVPKAFRQKHQRKADRAKPEADISR